MLFKVSIRLTRIPGSISFFKRFAAKSGNWVAITKFVASSHLTRLVWNYLKRTDHRVHSLSTTISHPGFAPVSFSYAFKHGQIRSSRCLFVTCTAVRVRSLHFHYCQCKQKVQLFKMQLIFRLWRSSVFHNSRDQPEWRTKAPTKWRLVLLLLASWAERHLKINCLHSSFTFSSFSLPRFTCQSSVFRLSPSYHCSFAPSFVQSANCFVELHSNCQSNRLFGNLADPIAV